MKYSKDMHEGNLQIHLMDYFGKQAHIKINDKGYEPILHLMFTDHALHLNREEAIQLMELLELLIDDMAKLESGGDV